MKAAFLPIACGAALALMAGAAAAHYLSVRQTLAMAQWLQSTPPPAPALPAEDPAVLEARRLLAEAKEKEKTPAPAAASGVDSARMERLLTALEGVVEQNQELRNQVAETNRDLMALQFQVDSHSQQFRPLNVAQESSYEADSAGVLPPRQTP